MPCSGAAIGRDGRLYLIEVDGRQPDLSVGTTRPQFAALMRAFGATEGLLLDGGGSSTLVARRLGDRAAEVTNSPSDGVERPVADGLFVYSTRADRSARTSDRAPQHDSHRYGRGYTAAHRGGRCLLSCNGERRCGQRGRNARGISERCATASFVPSRAGTGRLVLHGDGLRGEVPLEVDATPARTRVTPGRAPTLKNIKR